jgi:hypothetical protein
VVFVFACVTRVVDAQDGGTASGTVTSPAGQPVEGADVIVATGEKPAWPNVPAAERDEAKRGGATAKTDAAGRFTVELPPSSALLSISHPDSGYAELKPESLGEASPVKLEPWCRVEGVFKVGAKPAPAGTMVSLGVVGGASNGPRIHYAYSATTDAEGRYVLDRVPAGLNQIRTKASEKASPLDQYVRTEPGKAVRFDIGGKGRPVVGKLVLGTHLDTKNLNRDTDPSQRLLSNSHLRRNVPWPKQPTDGGGGGSSPEEREETARAWRKTPEAFEQWKDQYRCNVEFAEDGSFRFEDVPPGKYILTLTIYQRTGLIGVIRPEVEVPASPDLPTDQPLDLGDLKIAADAEGL